MRLVLLAPSPQRRKQWFVVRSACPLHDEVLDEAQPLEFSVQWQLPEASSRLASPDTQSVSPRPLAQRSTHETADLFEPHAFKDGKQR